jgi:hypothetical protein
VNTSPRRADHRLGLTVRCDVRQGCEPWAKVVLMDLSRTGFRIAWSPRFKPDAKLWIRIPGLQPLSATIRWQNQAGIGCEFTAPLYEPVFEHFARLAASEMRRSA